MSETQQELLDKEEQAESKSTGVTVADDVGTGPFRVALAADRTKIRQLANFVRQTRHEIAIAPDETEKAFLVAGMMRQLREAIDGPMLDDLCSLAGTPVGFKTDKDGKGGYSREVIRDVAICAMASGLRLVGNEINIIDGQMYATKQGFQRLLSELPGFCNLRFRFGIPDREITGKTRHGTDCGTAYVTTQASWLYGGVRETMDCTRGSDGDYRIPMKYYATDTDDLLLGKAESKLLRRIYRQVTGTDIASDTDGDEGTPQPYGAKVEPEPAAEPAPEPEAAKVDLHETMDKLEAWISPRLLKATMIGDCHKVRDEALTLLNQKTELTDEQHNLVSEHIHRLVDARIEDVRNSRGPRANKPKDKGDGDN